MDLDTAEAIAAGRSLLPATGWVFGRASAPRSHHEYRVAGTLETITFKDMDGAVLAELHYSGQTIYPPSAHADTEPVNTARSTRRPA